MVKLRKYQQDAVKAIANNPMGIISAATGSGKTTIMAAAIQKQKGSVLVLVHTRALVNQTVSRLKAETNRSVGAFYGEDKSGLGHEILVATWQSMIRLNGKLQFDHIHVDECHNTRGHKYGKLVKSISSKTLHGYTATLHGPGEDAVKSLFGEVIYEIGLFDLIQMGYLSKMKVLVNIGPVGARKYNESKFDIIRETTKENGTTQKALHFYSQNKRFNEVKDWNLLPSNTYYAVPGNVSRDKREVVFETFRNQNSGLNHLLANRVLNEGIDLPITNTLIFHETVGDFRTVSQRFGRGLRVYEGNDTDTTIIMLFVDEAKRNQIQAVDELINQVQYESKKRGKSAIKTIDGKTYKKHDNDPTDDLPVTISLIDRTDEILRSYKNGKQVKVVDFTLDSFVEDMRSKNISSLSQYKKVYKQMNYGVAPESKFNLTTRQLWDKVRGIQSRSKLSETFTKSDFIKTMVQDHIWNSGDYTRNIDKYRSRFGSKPEHILNMAARQLWNEVRAQVVTVENFIILAKTNDINTWADYTRTWKSIEAFKPFTSQPQRALDMQLKDLFALLK